MEHSEKPKTLRDGDIEENIERELKNRSGVQVTCQHGDREQEELEIIEFEENEDN